VLHGRDAERARVSALLADARAGTAGVLVIRGEPGVGKSALLEDARDAAAGMRVLSAQGLESEAPLAFAGLHQLLRPVLSLLDRLPAPQARALRIAFGQEDGPAEDPFLIALATLTMLSEAGEDGPVLCIVDDAHWLDAASAAALMFVARRLRADPVAVLFAARDGDVRTFVADGVPTLVLGGLSGPAARQVLDERIGASVPEAVAGALLERTGGNPLALVELPTSLTAEQLAGTAPISEHLQLTDRVQQVFLDRCRRLPAEVQTLLLVAAADDSGRLSVVGNAAARLGLPAGALSEAESAGMLVSDRDAVRVRHPLVRSAVYQAATGHERRAVHLALAAALTDDPDRQAWHQAAAADGPDAGVVAALEGAAERAARRGGFVAAAAAYERAAELCAGEQLRARMLFAAARNSWAAGQAERARSLARVARDDVDAPIGRADVDRLLGRVEVHVGSAAAAYRLFATAARTVEAVDPARAVEMWVAAALTHTFDHEATTGPGGIPAHVLQESRGESARTRCLRLVLASIVAEGSDEWSTALASLDEAVDAARDVTDADVIGNLGNAALHLGDDHAHRSCFTRMLADARDRSAVVQVLYALARLAFSDLTAGDWTKVRAAADESLALSTDIGLPALGVPSIAWLTLLAAQQGSPEYGTLRAQLDTAVERYHLGVFAGGVRDLSHWAAGVHAAHEGDAVGALRHLIRMKLPALARMAAVDRIEAAIRANERNQAVAWVEQLEEFAKGTQWPWALAIVDHGRGLLAEPADAPALLEAALAYHARSARRYDQARTHLALGELLRRSQRRTEARTHLRAAAATFEELRAQPLLGRAEQELRATGESARKRNPSTLTQLTPMELQIAQLVASGLSNKEAAAQCWISPRTVAFHLRNVFSKTGISSRVELARLDVIDEPVLSASAP